MSQYILVIVWLVIIYILSQMINVYTCENILGKKEKRVRKEFAVAAIAPLIWWAATRPRWFFDTNAYISGFEIMPNTWSELIPYMGTVTKDEGFYALSSLIKIIAGDNYRIYFFVLAVFQLIILAMVYRKYSTDYVMALFIFVTITDYLSWMHNGIRQFTAVTLIFAATGLMLEKKYVQLLAIILVASTIHGSALLMIPIVFVVQGKPWNKKTILAIVAFAIAIVFVDSFTDILDTMLSDTQYTNVVSDWQMDGDDGTNPIRVVVYSIPTILSLVGYRYIKSANDPVINLSCNMAILSTMLYCLSMVTSGIFIGRLPIYCSLYATGILLPWEIDHMFTRDSAKLIKLAMIGAFLLFYYYQVRYVWSLI